MVFDEVKVIKEIAIDYDVEKEVDVQAPTPPRDEKHLKRNYSFSRPTQRR